MPSVVCRTVDLCRRRSIVRSALPEFLLARLCRTPEQSRAQKSHSAALLPGHIGLDGDCTCRHWRRAVCSEPCSLHRSASSLTSTLLIVEAPAPISFKAGLRKEASEQRAGLSRTTSSASGGTHRQRPESCQQLDISARQEARPVLRATVGLACSRYAPVGISAPFIPSICHLYEITSISLPCIACRRLLSMESMRAMHIPSK